MPTVNAYRRSGPVPGGCRPTVVSEDSIHARTGSSRSRRRSSILGQTIADALHSLGYAGVADVRQGKYSSRSETTEAAQARRWRRSGRQAAGEPVIRATGLR
jgi:hypothetical protein